jgi:hypothetical protein
MPNVEWKCPGCGTSNVRRILPRFMCCCSLTDSKATKEDHGLTTTNPCPKAHCEQCGWSGTFPVEEEEMEGEFPGVLFDKAIVLLTEGLTKEEMIALFKVWDGDGSDSFFNAFSEVVAEMAPEEFTIEEQSRQHVHPLPEE